ncbi:hypothetical protein LEHPIFIF_00225 [Aeromonas phage avDM9-HANS]|nr:hypothetical protein LEHPIFIF_00225 [Aeromonas phage avDM9-HANS]
MKRVSIEARKDWLPQLTSEGVLWTTTEEGPYWSEALKQPKYYSFTKSEQESLENAANRIHEMCLETMSWLFEEISPAHRRKVFDMFNIPSVARDDIERSWHDDEWGLYGRFDFIMTKDGPKLLEYNADTPTILIESAISQWNWFKDNQSKFPAGAFQFNEIHEALVNHWHDMSFMNGIGNKVNFVATTQVDDFATIAYMAETASEAGLDVKMFDIAEIQLGDDGNFYDIEGQHVDTCFKLYPWEWMYEDEFGKAVPGSNTRFIEPAWKMMLSNKALLVLLYQRYPDCEWLVPAYMEEDFDQLNLFTECRPKWVSKPLLSREGCNVHIFEYGGKSESTDGNYGDEPRIVQEYIEWVDYDGCYPMLGVWMVGNDAVGLGIREDDNRITGNNSRFIPHIVEV